MEECTFSPKLIPAPTYLARQVSEMAAAELIVQGRLSDILMMTQRGPASGSASFPGNEAACAADYAYEDATAAAFPADGVSETGWMLRVEGAGGRGEVGVPGAVSAASWDGRGGTVGVGGSPWNVEAGWAAAAGSCGGLGDWGAEVGPEGVPTVGAATMGFGWTKRGPSPSVGGGEGAWVVVQEVVAAAKQRQRREEMERELVALQQQWRRQQEARQQQARAACCAEGRGM